MTVPAAVQAATLRLRRITSSVRVQSPYSFAQTAYDFMGGMWAAEMTLKHLDRRQNAEVEAWLASLDGVSKTFQFGAMDYDGPYGVMSANPTVSSSTADRVKEFWIVVPVGSAAVVGDYLTIGGHLHIVTSAGTVTVAQTQKIGVWPRLREAAILGQTVEMLAPYGTWAIANPETEYEVDGDHRRTRTLSLIEAL
ncbi:hypothetical protein BYZ73_19860 [Rhodovulum viride]|uniref:Uncharacterized protein n=1 Tax=Rhodovulum viride TaxID=1231134 RepID=A0ABX9DDV8_9RHOB|nr:hypothetical protein [Rhodovulum viride]RAP39562.1 hypothetical protein BYZ73_19860 [Rhodovulum viride]